MLSDATVIALLVAAPVYVACTAVLGLGAWSWSKAISQQHQANHLRVQSEVASRAIAAAEDVLDEADYPPAPPVRRRPTREEVEEAILREREDARDEIPAGAEYTTTANEGFEETPPGDGGKMYRDGGAAR